MIEKIKQLRTRTLGTQDMHDCVDPNLSVQS